MVDDIAWFAARVNASRGVGWSRRRESTRKGIIYDGSNTDKVLAIITAAAPRYLTRAEIVAISDCPAKSVDWALHYLRSIGKIKCQSLVGGRSSLYLKWGFSEDG